jgi:hypothetical protein
MKAVSEMEGYVWGDGTWHLRSHSKFRCRTCPVPPENRGGSAFSPAMVKVPTQSKRCDFGVAGSRECFIAMLCRSRRDSVPTATLATRRTSPKPPQTKP